MFRSFLVLHYRGRDRPGSMRFGYKPKETEEIWKKGKEGKEEAEEEARDKQHTQRIDKQSILPTNE